MHEIVKVINNIYKTGQFSYLLIKHVDPCFWDRKIMECFNCQSIDNLTDFNYGKCFSICINLSKTKALLGTNEFKEYIHKNQVLYRLEIQISALVPYAMRKYLKYYYDGTQILVEGNDQVFLHEHKESEKAVLSFLAKENLVLLDDAVLTIKVPGISLELHQGIPSVYNCLFDDCYDFFPYNKTK